MLYKTIIKKEFDSVKVILFKKIIFVWALLWFCIFHTFSSDVNMQCWSHDLIKELDYLYITPFPFLSGVSDFFCKIESKFLNSRVLSGGFVIGLVVAHEKISWWEMKKPEEMITDSKMNHRHGNLVTSIQCVRVNKSILYVTMLQSTHLQVLP